MQLRNLRRCESKPALTNRYEVRAPPVGAHNAWSVRAGAHHQMAELVSNYHSEQHSAVDFIRILLRGSENGLPERRGMIPPARERHRIPESGVVNPDGTLIATNDYGEVVEICRILANGYRRRPIVGGGLDPVDFEASSLEKKAGRCLGLRNIVLWHTRSVSQLYCDPVLRSHTPYAHSRKYDPIPFH